MPANYFELITPEGSGTLNSNFEIDGNTEVEDDVPGILDWDSVAFASKEDLPTGQTDDSFGQGTKEDSEPPTVVNGSVPNNKSDLTILALASEGLGSDTFLYLAWLRANTLGTANIDFELNQSGLFHEEEDNTVTPIRMAGDSLLSFDFTGGDNVVQLSLREWDGNKWGAPVDLNSSETAAGAVNDPATFGTDPGNVDNPFSPAAGDTLLDLTFGEAVVNLSDAFGADCRTFNSVYVKSRSSTSFTASLKDFIAPMEADINTCQTLTLTNMATATADGLDNIQSNTATIKITNDPDLLADAGIPSSELPALAERAGGVVLAMPQEDLLEPPQGVWRASNLI
ncbi:MAG: hypothetical protein JSV66_03380 [Trueperaceae bacterium]|nr:MAG: hypothetical protein JSV66_03380 [Trueperaceae bacterium]